MVRAGLGSSWDCLFANDFDHKKAAIYRENWGDDALLVSDVKNVSTASLLKIPDLVWASFPCQDLSLAGGGAGLRGDRSGTFWPFWGLMKSLIREKRKPKLIVLENVCGTLTSHKGNDFAAICKAFSLAGYRVGAMVINASLFVPQSRPRLFVIGVPKDLGFSKDLLANGPSEIWHPRVLKQAISCLSKGQQDEWLWWNLPSPPTRRHCFAEFIEENPDSVQWHTQEETKQLLQMMSPINRKKVEAAKAVKKKMVGAIYKRTRHDENGLKVQRAEIRFDDIAGCLRTPAGGSSRQLIMVIEKNKVRTRLISSRESARLMGLPDTYTLPQNYNEAYHLTGDGVVVHVVQHLSEHIFEPLLKSTTRKRKAVA